MRKIRGIVVVCLMAFILVACDRNTEQKKDSWVVTQYGDQSGKQGMFYTIYNEKKDVLVVVDGGWKDNTELVRSVIHSVGGRVAAWIVTHYHPDHVEALNEILIEPDGIVIDAIYDSPMDPEEYLQVATKWDSPETFTNYLELTSELPCVHHLARGDSFTISDLNFTVYNTYDETAKISGDIPNNASLVFKVQGPKKSMLFCADVHTNEMAQKLMSLYGDALKADYLQAGHHGNNSIDREFYDLVSPSVIFLDAPDWLVVEEKYQTDELVAYGQENDILHYWYASAPNSVTLD